MTREDRLCELVEQLDEYIKFIGVEHGELAVMASNRGWESKSIAEGVRYREEIKALRVLIFTK